MAENQQHNLIIRENIPYATHDGVTLLGDLYLPAKSKTAVPILIGVHGGGWERGDRKSFRNWGHYLPQRGYGCLPFNTSSPSRPHRLIRRRCMTSALPSASCAARLQNLEPMPRALACSGFRPAAISPHSRLWRATPRASCPAPLTKRPPVSAARLASTSALLEASVLLPSGEESLI